MSHTSSPSAFRTPHFTGTMYLPSFGHSDLFHPVAPIPPGTGPAHPAGPVGVQCLQAAPAPPFMGGLSGDARRSGDEVPGGTPSAQAQDRAERICADGEFDAQL